MLFLVLSKIELTRKDHHVSTCFEMMLGFFSQIIATFGQVPRRLVKRVRPGFPYKAMIKRFKCASIKKKSVQLHPHEAEIRDL